MGDRFRNSGDEVGSKLLDLNGIEEAINNIPKNVSEVFYFKWEKFEQIC